MPEVNLPVASTKLGRSAKTLVALATITVAACSVVEPITDGQLQFENATEGTNIETYWRPAGNETWVIGPVLKPGEVGKSIYVEPGTYEIRARYVATDFIVTIHDQKVEARMIKILRFQ